MLSLAWLLGLCSHEALGQGVPVNGDFESDTLSSWTGTGDARVIEQDVFAGQRSLLLARTGENLVDTKAVSDRFELAPGTYDVASAVRSDLYTQDMSFNVSMHIEFFDNAGKALQRLGVFDVSGKTAWRPLRKRLTAPPGTAGARVTIEVNKTHGKVWVDAITIKPSQATATDMPRRVTFASRYMGNMLYPDDQAVLSMNLQTPQRLPESHRKVSWDVRDYWSAPVSDRRVAALVERGQTPAGTWEYTASLDASDLPLKVGPYYQVNTSVTPGVNLPAAEDETSFAVLPQSSAFLYDQGQLPFGTHTWDARVEPYFILSARMGLRRCLVFWNWPHEAPYTPSFNGWEYECRLGYPKKYGLAPYGLVYPAFDIERGDYRHTDESLREGLRQTIENHKKDGLWGFQIGNEPPHWNQKMMERDVEIYRIQYETIKKTDPSMFVIGSAIGPNEDFFKLGFQHYCDAMNIHGYGDLGEQRRNMRKYAELFAKYGGKKPIYSTEIGSMSQGLTRHEIACDIIRKASCFFADGGEFFTWFAITYPDKTGTRRGSYGDSMDLFAGYLEQYNPRLDAVGYFHYVDQMGAKKFIQEQTYPSGATAMLFRDAQNNCLQVIWNIAGESADVLVPLADVYDVRVTHIDGAGGRLNAGGRGVTIRVGNEPSLLSYRQAEGTLSDAFGPPAVALDGAEPQLVQGGVSTITLDIAKDAGDVALAGPAFWTIEKTADEVRAEGGRRVSYRIGVPATSTARAGRIVATLTRSDRTDPGRLLFTLPVRSTINADIVPLASIAPGKAGVELVLKNNGDKPQNVGWAIEIASQTPMEKGEFDHGHAQPADAYFTDVSEGRLDLAAGEEKRITLNLAQVDPLTLYKVRSQVTDAAGKAVVRERFMGGFAGVHRIAKPLTIDGVLDDADWARSAVLKIDDARQFFSYIPEGRWKGPADLSGDLRFLWDDQNLYISVAVTDDVFSNSKSDNSLWSMDGVQFLFDPYRDRLEKLGRYDYFGGVGQKGAQMWCGLTADGRAPTGEVKEIQIAGKRTSDTTGSITYEIAVPWSRVAPFTPSPGRNLGISFLLNEDDGLGRKTFLAWFSGAHSKTVNQAGDLILLPE